MLHKLPLKHNHIPQLNYKQQLLLLSQHKHNNYSNHLQYRHNHKFHKKQ